jgi:hypothetical protein
MKKLMLASMIFACASANAGLIYKLNPTLAISLENVYMVVPSAQTIYVQYNNRTFSTFSDPRSQAWKEIISSEEFNAQFKRAELNGVERYFNLKSINTISCYKGVTTIEPATGSPESYRDNCQLFNAATGDQPQ